MGRICKMRWRAKFGPRALSLTRGLHDGTRAAAHVCLFSLPFDRSVFIDDFLASGLGDGGQLPQLEFEQLPFNHPLFIMYSSGTTGAPKCMVHSAGVSNRPCVDDDFFYLFFFLQ